MEQLAAHRTAYVRAMARYALKHRTPLPPSVWSPAATASLSQRLPAGHPSPTTKGGQDPLLAQKVQALAAVHLFAGLQPPVLEVLARMGKVVVYAPGDVVCEQDDDAREVYVVLDGEAVASRQEGGAERVLGRVGAGDVIGEMAILDPAPRMASVRAGAAGARVLCLESEAFRAALVADSKVALRVLRTLTRRLREAQAQGRQQQAQIQQLRIEINQAQKARQVAAITENEYFRQLQSRARTLRHRTDRSRDPANP